MNSPLIPQGSTVEQQDKARSSLKTKVFVAIGVNVAVLLGLLLMPGCKREQPAPEIQPEATYTDTNTVPGVTDTNYVAAPDTNVVQQAPPPIVEPTPPAIPEPTASEYTIQKGDTYSSIAPKFNISIAALKSANPTVDPAKLQIGKKINIPAATLTATPTSTGGGGTVVDVASGMTTYTVKSGDTLGKLATEFHTTVKAIQSANGLADTKIKVGQKLKIPTKQ